MSCDSAHHDADHGDLDEGEVGADAVFDVLGEASAAVEPAEGTFDDPALGQDGEALGGVRSFDDSGGPAAWRMAHVSVP